MMGARVEAAVRASLLLRTRRTLCPGEDGLAISGSHAVFGARARGRYKLATPVGGGWWHVHVYVPHGTKIWWKWLILDNKGDETGRETGADRCLTVATDSLLVTAEWNTPMEVHHLWPGEREEVATHVQGEVAAQELDPGRRDTDQYIMSEQYVNSRPSVFHSPKRQWGVIVPSLNNNCPSYVSRYRPAADSDKPTEGLGSDLHVRQMAAAVTKEVKLKTEQSRVQIDQEMAKLLTFLDTGKRQSVTSVSRLVSGVAFTAEALWFGNDPCFVQNIWSVVRYSRNWMSGLV